MHDFITPVEVGRRCLHSFKRASCAGCKIELQAVSGQYVYLCEMSGRDTTRRTN